jgi:uncharacterized protein YndB with AHSA1/START domain
MASIRKETIIDAPPERVWNALRDWGAPHERLVPGFVVDTRLDGSDRIVTFFTGAVVREVLIDLDDGSRRLAWSIVDAEGGSPYTHHNGFAQVFEDGQGRTKFVWITDLLPDDQAQRTSEMMERGTQTIKRTLERAG